MMFVQFYVKILITAWLLRARKICEVNDMNCNFSDDAIQAGIQKVLGAKVVPFTDPNGKVWFRIEQGNDEALVKLYNNEKVGALDALEAIKSMRQAIFALKKNHGNGRTNDGFKR
jgi:hypothetical protein